MHAGIKSWKRINRKGQLFGTLEYVCEFNSKSIRIGIHCAAYVVMWSIFFYNVYHFSSSTASTSNDTEHQVEMKRVRDILEKLENSGETNVVPEVHATVMPSSDGHSVPTSQTRPDLSDEASSTRYN